PCGRPGNCAPSLNFISTVGRDLSPPPPIDRPVPVPYVKCLSPRRYLRERGQPRVSPLPIHEDEVVRRWFALPFGTRLPFSDGDSCQLVFHGRVGSAAGPDVHDAILRFTGQGEKTIVGDIEFHVYASDWYAHGHQSDARYNNVILHVVLVCDIATPILRSDGTAIPMCSLYDVVPAIPMHVRTPQWPCQQVVPNMSEQERSNVLRQAGLLRFEQKADAFVEQLHNGQPSPLCSANDASLIVALAEGLGYGRDRAFFRAAGAYLSGCVQTIPEPLGHTFDPPPLDSGRLVALRTLVARWREGDAWETLKKVLLPSAEPAQSIAIIAGLRAVFAEVGSARADILICNCVLPFALAVALVENDTLLAKQAMEVYLSYPGLSSNRITRAMSRQLLLAHEPEGACRQQGLHYIYQQTCREKHCAVCMLGKRLL
ncbi:MAG: DUF2851 family protein, partial [Ktedonobacteraceae bacterium]